MNAARHVETHHADTNKAYKGAGMEGWIARWYARTRRHDLEEFRRQAEDVARKLPSGARVLEVAPGPGYFAVALAKLGDFQISGIDISHTFVQLASDYAREAGVTVGFRQGNAAAMPFADASFDLVYCSAAFKNFAEPVTAINEMHRVLTAGGQAIIVDLRKDVSRMEIEDYVKKSGRSHLDTWITTMTFKHMLIKRAFTREEFTAMARASKFGDCEINQSAIGYEVLLSKQRFEH